MALRVPTYQPQVSLDTPNVPRPNLPDPIRAQFGENVVQANQGLADVGSALGKALERRQQEKYQIEQDQLETSAYTQYQMDKQKALLDDEEEEVNVGGRKITRPRGIFNRSLSQTKGATIDFDKWSNEYATKVLGGIQDQDTKAKLASRLANDVITTRASVIKHELDEDKKDKVNTQDSAIKLAVNNAFNAKNQKELDILINDGALAAFNKGKILGTDENTTKLEMQKAVSDIVEQSILGNIEKDKTGATSRAILESSKNKLSGEAYTALNNKIDSAIKDNQEKTDESLQSEIIDGTATIEKIVSMRPIIGESNYKSRLKEFESIQRSKAASLFDNYDFSENQTELLKKADSTIQSMIFDPKKRFELNQNIIEMMKDGLTRDEAKSIQKINDEIIGKPEKRGLFQSIYNKAKDFYQSLGHPTFFGPAEHILKLVGATDAEAASEELMRQDYNKAYPSDPIKKNDKVVDPTRERQISFKPIQRFGEGIARGASASVESFGGGLQWLGAKDVGKMVENYGKTAREYYKVEDPKFVDQVAEGFGSLATFYVPGLGIAKGVQAVTYFPRLAAWIGVSASTALEATVEAGSTYKQAIENGYGEKSAGDSATATFWGNIPTIAITNKLGLFGEAGPKFAQVIASGALEGLQEFSQSLVQNIALNDPLAFKDAFQSAAVGVITGSGVKTAVTVTQTLDELGVGKELKDRLANAKGPNMRSEKGQADFLPGNDKPKDNLARDENGKPIEINNEATSEDQKLLEFKPMLEGEGFIGLSNKQSREMLKMVESLPENVSKREALKTFKEVDDKLGKESSPNELKSIIREQTGQTQESKVLLNYLKDKYSEQIKAGALEDQIEEKLAQAINPSEVKKVVREQTGQVQPKQEKTVTDKQAHIQSLKDRVKAAKQAENFTKEQVFDTQSELINLINQSDLEASDKAKFLPMIKNVQTGKDLAKVMKGSKNKKGEVVTPGLEERINTLIDKEERRQIIRDISKTVERAAASKSIAVDYVKAIQEAVSGIDLKQRRPDTLKRIEKMKDFLNTKINKGQDVEVTRQMLKDLSILDKKRFDEVSNEELQDLLNNIEQSVQLGETKLRAMQNLTQIRKQKAIEELVKSSVPIESKQVKIAKVGEKLTGSEKFRNRLSESFNFAQEKDLAITPQDVVFDVLDGNKNYKGANYRIFKKTVDEAFSKYLTRVDSITEDVSKLANELKLDDTNLERIGFFAAKVQEGGNEKLQAMGYTQEEIDAVKLDAKETKLYSLMREKLDELRPDIQEVMRVAYNKDLGMVEDYFPFMTDFDAMSDSELRDRFGDSVELFGQAKRKNVEKGFTEKRVGGKQKIKLNAMEVFLRHIDNASYLIETGPIIKELGDIASSPEYGQAVGEIGQERVRSWIDLLARKGGTEGKRWRPADVMRKHVGVATLGFKLSSALIQPTALMDGAAILGGKAFEGAWNVATNKEWRVFLKNNFPELRARGADDPAYLEFGGKELIDKAGRAGFWALRNLDALTASSIVAGAYTQAVEEKGGMVDFENPDQEAIVEAQRILRRTQASPFFKDVPSAISQGELTGNVSLDKMILQFQTFMLNRWSLIRHDMYRSGFKAGNIGQGLNVAMFLALAGFAEIGLRRFSKEMIALMTDDDLEDWPETFKQEAVMAMVNNVPFISQGVSAVNYGTIPVPSVDMAKRIIDRANAVAKSKKEETKKRNFVRAMMLGLGVVFKVPGTVQGEQLVRELMGDDKRGGTSNPFGGGSKNPYRN
jgi:hypothetical protein